MYFRYPKLICKNKQTNHLKNEVVSSHINRFVSDLNGEFTSGSSCRATFTEAGEVLQSSPGFFIDVRDGLVIKFFEDVCGPRGVAAALTLSLGFR